MTVVDHVKLFRNRPDLRFDGRIHEQILPAIRRVGGEVAWTDLYVVHSGSDHEPGGSRRESASATCGSSSRSWRSVPSTLSRSSTWA